MMGSVHTSLVLCVTGGIACGKSEVGRMLGEMGFEVCDADHVAHDLMKKGTPVYQQIVAQFGKQILFENGEISRPVLGEIVFKNPEERSVLNNLVHPAVREKLTAWMTERRHQGNDAAVLIPLLFESKMDVLDWDAVLCVSSSEELVFQRLEKRGLTHEEAALRMMSQMPLEEKEHRSDHVIPNLGTLDELDNFTRDTVKRIKTER